MSLNELLKKVLPYGSTFKSLHVQSQPRQSKNLLHYSSKNEDQPKLTLKVKHFFSLLDSNEVILLGIEINVYVTILPSRTEHQIFVSKADTTGIRLLKQLGINVGDVISAFLKYLLTVDVKSYTTGVKLLKKNTAESVVESLTGSVRGLESDNPTVKSLYTAADCVGKSAVYYQMIKDFRFKNAHIEKMKAEKQLVQSATEKKVEITEPISILISFFTRAEKQYLFPESYRNPHKHVIDGKQLLNWWLKIINSVLGDSETNTWECKLSIPGSDEESVKKFYSSLSRKANLTWSSGSLYGQNLTDLAIYDIPLFPDDPKGRFLEHLVVENRYKSTSSKQFWEELGIRQEFRLGNLVGIIGAKSGPMSNTSSLSTVFDFVSFGDYQKILNCIKEGDYSDDEAKVIIRKDVRNILKDIGKTNCIHVVQGVRERLMDNLQPRTESSGDRRPAVNNLTGLIKRKKK